MITSHTPLLALIPEELANAALAARLPLLAFSETFVPVGALMSYGASLRDHFSCGAGRWLKRRKCVNQCPTDEYGAAQRSST